MNKLNATVVSGVVFLFLLAGRLPAGNLKFQAHLLSTENSGTWAQTGVADIDNDGRLDFVAGNYGGIFADFDGDGDIDIVSKCWCNRTTFVLLENKHDPRKATPKEK